MKGRRVLVVRALVALGLVGVCCGGLAVAQQRAAAAMAGAATAFLDGLTPEQRAKATYPLGSDELTRWNFIPTSMFPRNGLPIKEMTADQRERAHALLRASLSQAGYQTATDIMALEEVLREMESGARGRAAGGLAPGAPRLAVAQGGRGGRGGGIVRDPELYFFTVFGTPSAGGQWALRVEGHHLSLHLAIDGGRMMVTSTPTFMGANPAEVRSGVKSGQRVLGAQEDTARALLDGLTPVQREAAILSATPPREIETGTTLAVDPLVPAGLLAADMTAGQQAQLMAVIDTFASTQTPDVVAARMADIREAGLDRIGFAWFGSSERGQRYHYRIQGPTFLIEHNNTQNNGNHVHSVWRDFDGDFGRDLLAEHMAAYQH